ncbi:tigger transposable element-derived protein 6-like [Euwallacea similis]|uniref:tigger transposable element-derived protein 6-like n=1 Tax=Euwallacea similis TaxID=1736056 RepID=UPI00344EDF5B
MYNADETDLFLRALPDKTYKSEKCSGGKLSKERLSILILCQYRRTQRRIAYLPVTWRFNKKAWTTQDIMNEWLLQFDRKMVRQKRKILLFLDNTASHLREVKLQNINLVVLPPNTTSVYQPLDQGII